MYQISLKGYIETENVDKLLELINNAIKDTDSYVYGQFISYALPPYVEYQNSNVVDA